jgi:hypothetical protein
MPSRSQAANPEVGFSAIAIFISVHVYWNVAIEPWLQRLLGHFMTAQLAEVVERVWSLGFPLICAVAFSGSLLRYLHLRKAY